MSKAVTFAKKNTIKFVSPKNIGHHETDVLYVKQALLSFLRENVFDVIEDLGRFVRGNMDPNHIDHEHISVTLAKMARSLFGPRVAHQHFEQIVGNFEGYSDRTVADFIQAALKTPEGHMMRASALLILRAGLKTFIDFKHCANECANSPSSSVKRACAKAYDEIEEELGRKTIHKFDELLRKASRDTCSLVAIKTATIRFGSKK
jgi:hypothetical protein